MLQLRQNFAIVLPTSVHNTGGEWKFGNSVVLNSFTKIVKIDPRYHSTAPILANVYRVVGEI